MEGIGNFTSGYNTSFSLTDSAQKIGRYNPPRDLTKCTFTLRDYTYKGTEIRPIYSDNLIVRDNGRIVSDTNYSVIGYENNTEIGTATMIIKGRGSYTGIYRLKFRITQRQVDSVTTSAK